MYVTQTVQLAASPDRVWRAFIDPAITTQYFFGCRVVSSWGVGDSVHYETSANGVTVVHVRGSVRVFDEPSHLEMSCRGVKPDGSLGPETIATYRLAADGAGTRLEVTQGPFDDEKGEHHESSWKWVLDGLKAVVESPAD